MYRILGGARVVRERGPEYGGLAERIREGLPYAALESVVDKLQLEKHEVSSVLHVSPRTLARRKAERRLDPAESDRLVRLARILAYAIEVFGDEENATKWLRRPNRALGGDIPLTLLDTDVGSREVEAILGRIQYGVYS